MNGDEIKFISLDKYDGGLVRFGDDQVTYIVGKAMRTTFSKGSLKKPLRSTTTPSILVMMMVRP